MDRFSSLFTGGTTKKDKKDHKPPSKEKHDKNKKKKDALNKDQSPDPNIQISPQISTSKKDPKVTILTEDENDTNHQPKHELDAIISRWSNKEGYSDDQALPDPPKQKQQDPQLSVSTPAGYFRGNQVNNMQNQPINLNPSPPLPVRASSPQVGQNPNQPQFASPNLYAQHLYPQIYPQQAPFYPPQQTSGMPQYQNQPFNPQSGYPQVSSPLPQGYQSGGSNPQQPSVQPQGGYPPQQPSGQPQGGYPPQQPSGQPQGGYPPQQTSGQPQGPYPPQQPSVQPQGGYPPPQQTSGQPQGGQYPYYGQNQGYSQVPYGNPGQPAAYSPMQQQQSPPLPAGPQAQDRLQIANQLSNLKLSKEQFVNQLSSAEMAKLEAKQQQQQTPPVLPVGTDDHYEIDPSELQITREIARGSFGVVYQGLFRGTDVAIKKLIKQSLTDLEMQEFLSEFNMMKRVHHPNIVLLIGVCSKPSNLTIVTEFLTGSMWNLLHDKHVVIDYKLTMKLITDTAKGMNYLHLFKPPILHRDLKSANLLVDKNFNVKIADFGLARMKAQNMTGNLGTCQYMAPEVITSQNYTERADVYSFGIVMWEVMSREVPYPDLANQQIQLAYAVVHSNLRPPIRQIMQPQLVQLMQQAWATDPNARPSFSTILDTLNKLPH